MCKGVGVTLCLLQTHFSYWWMGDGCVRYLLQKKNRNIVSSSFTLVGFAGLAISHFKLSCCLWIQKFTVQ